MSLNRKLNLISAEEQIGEFLFDFDIDSATYIPILNRHISRAIELLEIDSYYIRCVHETKSTEEGIIYIPCNAKNLELIVVRSGGHPLVLDIDNNNLSLLSKFNLTDTNYLAAYVEGNYVKSTLEEGTDCYIIHKSPPIDKKGFIYIPDDPFLREAINYFLIFKMGLSGYKHKVLSMQDAKQLWDKESLRARNSVNFPSVEEMQRFTEMWNNPLKGDYFNNLFSQ